MARLIALPHPTVHTTPEEMLAPPLRVLECRVFRGPHVYSHTPMIRVQVDLGMLEEWPTDRLTGFAEKLVAALPGLADHGCSYGKAGGFIKRMQEGTWMGHVIEHVALELQVQAGIEVSRGKTRSVKGMPGHYNIMYAYRYEEAGRMAGRIAIELVDSLLDQPPFTACKGVEQICAREGAFDLAAGIEAIKRLARREKLGPTTQSLVEEAERRGIPWQRLDDQSLVQLGTGRHRKLVRASITSATSNLAVETACDKALTKKLLHSVNVPVPVGDSVRTVEGALEVAEEVGYPVVVKPLDGNHGRGVSTNLTTPQQVAEAFARAQEHSSRVIVERFYTGKDYRVLVVNGEIVAVAERVPAQVMGNGKDTIAQLIACVNEDPRRGEGHEEVMTRIAIDETLMAWLARAGLTLESVPALGQQVVLAATANLSTGGMAIDRTDEIHPDNATIARRAALTIGLDVAGLDFILPDISRSCRETGGGIVEVNACPGFRMHLHPAEGKSRDVAKAVISSLFPVGEKTHVPVICITGTNGKSTTVRMVSHILRQAGMCVGYTSTSGIYVNDECIWKGDASGPKSAKILMRDPTLDVIVLETARGGILREGLGVMDCDVGAVLNVTEDHLGIGGIHTLEDLAAVKSVVAETVRREGMCVLNADDVHTFAMAQHAGGTPCYFSMLPLEQGPLQDHVAAGGTCLSREYIDGDKGYLVLHQDGHRIPLLAVQDIPATLGGAVTFNIENAMAAAAIATGLQVKPEVIRLALSSFASTFEHNPGRFNIHDGHGFRVIMDYAHNPAGLNALFHAVHAMRANYGRVIGRISTPGDRRDEDILEVGRIAGRELDFAVFREGEDARGRKPGQLLELLVEGATSAGCRAENMACVHSEAEANALCLQKAQPGDLVILTPTDIDACWKQVLEFQPSQLSKTPAVRIEEMRYYA